MSEGHNTSNITKIDRAEEVVPGNYFRRTKNDKSGYSYKDLFKKDLLVLVTKVEGRKVGFTFPNFKTGETYDFTQDINTFLNEHKLDPNGKAARDAEFRDAVVEAQSIVQEIQAETESLTGIDQTFRPHALIGKDISTAPGEPEADNLGPALEQSDSVSLTRTGQQSTMLEQAQEWIGNIAERRNALTRKKADLDAKRKAVHALQAEAAKWMNALMRVKDITHKLEEVIATLQLYLGTGEEIIQLTNGKPCDANTPLTIRQLVLCMDEECALESESQGIDAYEMEEFDKWILDKPENLRQVLPEEKGIVCLKPRRHPKDYGGDPEYNARLNVANRKTYILIRNGENLFRVCPEWEVGRYFFPTKNEFDGAFSIKKEIRAQEAERRGISTADWSEHELKSSFGKKVKVVITPEDDEYDEVCEKLDARMAHYSKALILLQGIVDRTGIFPEYQQIGLNLMDVSQWTNYLRFVHDADPAFLLTTGRETFDEWLKRVNESLSVGDRIIGLYRKIELEMGRDDSRIKPKHASQPDEFGLYTLEGRDEYGELFFKYARTDERYVKSHWDRRTRKWVGGDYQGYKTRATFNIRKNDRYIIAYDALTLEEIEYFMTDRLSRPDYLTIFPLVKRVRNMKRVEREEEQPFIRLLMGEAMKLGYDLSESELEKEVLEVIHWYKFKNKVHRSLAGDENLAVRMCVTELRLRHDTNLSREKSPDELIVEDLKTPDTLFIGVRRDTIIVLTRANKDKIFTHRVDHRKTRKGYTELSRKEYYIPGSEYANWQVLYEHEEWATWPKGARAKDFLTPEQLRAFLEEYSEKTSIDAATRGMFNSCRFTRWGERSCCVWKRTYLLAITVSTERRITLHYAVISECEGEPRFQTLSYSYKWAKKKDQVVLSDKGDGWGSGGWSMHGAFHVPVGWAHRDETGQYVPTHPEHWDPQTNKAFIYFLDIDAINEYAKRHKEGVDMQEELREKENFFNQAKQTLTRHINEARTEAARQKYLANYGDPLNWESYLKKEANVKALGLETLDYHYLTPITKLLGELYVAGKISPEDVYDKTLREVIDLIITKDPHKADETKVYELGSTDGVDQDQYIFLPRPEPELPEEKEGEELEDEDIEEEWEHV